MQTLRVNGYDMAFLEVGNGPPLVGAATWGPCSYSPGTPDMFFYGIHGIELLFVLMGTGCESVSRVQTVHVRSASDHVAETTSVRNRTCSRIPNTSARPKSLRRSLRSLYRLVSNVPSSDPPASTYARNWRHCWITTRSPKQPFSCLPGDELRILPRNWSGIR